MDAIQPGTDAYSFRGGGRNEDYVECGIKVRHYCFFSCLIGLFGLPCEGYFNIDARYRLNKNKRNRRLTKRRNAGFGQSLVANKPCRCDFMKDRTSYLILGLFGLLVGGLLILFPAPADRMLNIQNYLITVGGIISAFVIAYLSSKIFNLRSERAARQIEIDKYSDKLTLFRRLLFYVMKSPDFWNYYDHIAKFKKKYSGLTYSRLHRQSEEIDELVTKFWLEEKELSSSTVDLYCAMESIAGSADPEKGYMMTWHVNKAARFDYTLDELSEYYDPCNQIWYYLEGRYGKHGQGRFNDTGIWMLYQNDVSDLMARLNPKYRGQDFHRAILAEIASEFYEFNLPRLYDLTRQNVGVPKSLLRTFNSLFFIMLFGVLFPIILQSINVNDGLNVSLTLVFIWLTSLGLLNFMLDFYKFINNEVHLSTEKNHN